MKTFLVGGAVRDKLLNLPVKDHDWVVIGSTPEEMEAKGFQPVGQDFPVFLHPKTKEEYALARTERKSGHGYAGFTFHTSPDVTLEEDLIRRDLTINAIAQDDNGTIVDPYGGQKDLTHRLLRHVSSAFQEDPLRILRTARFSARFHTLGFSVADETMGLMKTMVSDGEASWLVTERVWQETVRALGEPSPEVYFDVLTECGALGVVMPELAELWQEPLARDALKMAAANKQPNSIRFSLLFIQAEDNAIQQFSKRIRCPANFTELARLSAEHYGKVPELLHNLSGESVVSLFEHTDAFRRKERFGDFLTTAQIAHDVRGISISNQQIEDLQEFLDQSLKVNAKEIVEKGFKGRAVGEQLRLKRIELIESLLT